MYIQQCNLPHVLVWILDNSYVYNIHVVTYKPAKLPKVPFGKVIVLEMLSFLSKYPQVNSQVREAHQRLRSFHDSSVKDFEPLYFDSFQK